MCYAEKLTKFLEVDEQCPTKSHHKHKTEEAFWRPNSELPWSLRSKPDA